MQPLSNSLPIEVIETTDMPRPENTAMIPLLAITDEVVRCWRCKRKLADLVSRPWQLTCGRCKSVNASAPDKT